MLMAHDKSREDTASLMAALGRKARAAARPLVVASAERKQAALLAMADAMLRSEDTILAANAIDVKNGAEAGLSESFMDRLNSIPRAFATWPTAYVP